MNTPKKFNTYTEAKLALNSSVKNIDAIDKKVQMVNEIEKMLGYGAEPQSKKLNRPIMKKNEWEPFNWKNQSGSYYVLRMLSSRYDGFSIVYLDKNNKTISNIKSALTFNSESEAFKHLSWLRNTYQPLKSHDIVIHDSYTTTQKVKRVELDTVCCNNGYRMYRADILDVVEVDKQFSVNKVVLSTITALSVLAGLYGGSQVYLAPRGLTEKELGRIEDFKEETGLEVGDMVLSKPLGKFKTPYKKTGIITGFYPNDYTMEIEIDWAEGQRDRVYEGDIVGVIE